MNPPQRTRRRLEILIAAAAVLLAAAAPALAGSDKYAAIAYSPNTGAFGYSSECPTRTRAEKEALAKCMGDDAQVLVWARNGWCCLAVGDDHGYGYAWADDKEYAKKLALSECGKQTGNCKIAVAVSSDGEVEK